MTLSSTPTAALSNPDAATARAFGSEALSRSFREMADDLVNLLLVEAFAYQLFANFL